MLYNRLHGVLKNGQLERIQIAWTPGYVTMKNGLVDFYNKMDGFGIISRYLDKDYLHKMAMRISGELPR